MQPPLSSDCRVCGQASSANARFCRRCGCRLTPSRADAPAIGHDGGEPQALDEDEPEVPRPRPPAGWGPPVAVHAAEPETFLALLSDGDLDALLTLGSTRRFARGERVMRQGEPGDRVLILLSGHVKA